MASCLFERSMVDRRVVFKITSGSKQSRLDKLLIFLWFVFAKTCLKNWTLDTNFQAKGSTDKIIQNFQTDSVIRVAESVVTANLLSHVLGKN